MGFFGSLRSGKVRVMNFRVHIRKIPKTRNFSSIFQYMIGKKIYLILKNIKIIFSLFDTFSVYKMLFVYLVCDFFPVASIFFSFFFFVVIVVAQSIPSSFDRIFFSSKQTVNL